MTTAAELRIIERARRQPSINARPEAPPLTLTAPVRRLVQASLFVGLPSTTAPAATRLLWSVP